MKKLAYVLINSEIDLTRKHKISATRDDLTNHITPLLDTEYLLYGELSSKSKVELRSKGFNIETFTKGNILTPMIGVRAILKKLKQKYDVTVFIINIGLEHLPYVDHDKSEFKTHVININTLYSDNRRVIGKAIKPLFLFNISHTAGKFGETFFKNYTSKDKIIIAECVPGGTTTAQCVLSLTLKDEIFTASSSNNLEIHESKNLVVSGILKSLNKEEDYQDLIYKVCDYYHVFASCLLYQLYDTKVKAKIILAGGTQALSVLAIMDKNVLNNFPNLITSTTRWVINSVYRLGMGKLYYENVIGKVGLFFNHKIDFIDSKHNGLREYENGVVKEGCGLGALLYLGGTEFKNKILPWIDDEVTAFKSGIK